MKNTLYLVFLLFFGTINAQDSVNEYINSFVVESKSESKIDPKDLTVKKIYDSFYNEILQSEIGELSEEFTTDLNVIIDNPETKNMHLLSMLFFFQEYIFQASEDPTLINSELQLKLIEKMESEFLALNQEIPVLVYIYKIEALQTSENFDEADRTTQIAFEKFPDSVPLKVFQYLVTNDETLRVDLLKNHPNHWFVKQIQTQ